MIYTCKQKWGFKTKVGCQTWHTYMRVLWSQWFIRVPLPLHNHHAPQILTFQTPVLLLHHHHHHQYFPGQMYVNQIREPKRKRMEKFYTKKEIDQNKPVSCCMLPLAFHTLISFLLLLLHMELFPANCWESGMIGRVHKLFLKRRTKL